MPETGVLTRQNPRLLGYRMIIVVQGNSQTGAVTLAHEGIDLAGCKQVLEGMVKAIEAQMQPQSRLIVPPPSVPPDLLHKNGQT